MTKRHNPAPKKIKVPFNRGRWYDRYSVLTKLALGDYEKMVVNDNLRLEAQHCQGLTSQGTLVPSISMNKVIKVSKPAQRVPRYSYFHSGSGEAQ